MSDLDYFTLSRALGATMQPIAEPVFGAFGLLPLSVETAKSRLRPDTPKPAFTLQHDKRIVSSFEKSRNGTSLDALLWDMQQRNRFVEACEKTGLEFAPADMIRRLLAIRKYPQRFAKLGITFSPTTRKDNYPEVLVEFTPVIEFSLVRLRYRYGASIDDILIEPDLGQQFEDAVFALLPMISSKSARFVALTLRKMRAFGKNRPAQLKKMQLTQLERVWTPYQSLASLNISKLPAQAGIVEVREPSRDLYLSRNENLQGALKLFAENHAVSIMANQFWQPNLDDIKVRFIPASSLAQGDLERWELKLLSEKRPVFNWPIAKPRRAA